MKLKHRFARAVIRGLADLTAHIDVEGLENLPKGNALVVGNHLGRLDTVALYRVFDRDDLIMPIAGKYRAHPLFGLLGWASDAVWLRADGSDADSLRQLLRRMRDGGFLVMAPEGTRSPTEALQEAKPGAAFLAVKSGFPVVPAAVMGSEDRLVKANLRKLRRSRLRLRVGKPFELGAHSGHGREQAYREATDEIMCRIAVLLTEKYRGFYTDHPRLKALLEGQ
jgi:1-acyl-sn-glycerol-3-phosphate acyltransferase